MKNLIAIIILFISADSFAQTASSRPLSSVAPDSLRRPNQQPRATVSPEVLPSAKSLPAIALESKKEPGRVVNPGDLPGNAPVNVDSISHKNRRFRWNR